MVLEIQEGRERMSNLRLDSSWHQSKSQNHREAV